MINKNKIKNYLDDSLLAVYQLMLDEEIKEVDEYIDIYWDLIENVYGYILNYIRNKIKEAKKVHLNVKELLYDDLDEDRIKKYFEEFKAAENVLEARMRFLHQLSKIFVTETGLVRDRTFIEMGKVLMEVYHYWISVTYEPSECGESEEASGTESEECIILTIKNQKDFENIYERDFDCSHPNCPGHVTDIDIDKEEKGEMELEDIIEEIKEGTDFYV